MASGSSQKSSRIARFAAPAEPENGTDYSISVAPAEHGAVRVTGYSGRAVLSRTYARSFEVWERVAPPAVPCNGPALTS